MSSDPTNPLVSIGGKVFGPIGNILKLTSRLERLIDTVTRLREDQIALQDLVLRINTRSVSNRDKSIDFRQRSEEKQTRTDRRVDDLKRANADLQKEVAEMKATITELKYKIELDAKDREIELLKFKSDVQQAVQAQTFSSISSDNKPASTAKSKRKPPSESS